MCMSNRICKICLKGCSVGEMKDYKISLFGAVIMLVGTVIGAGIYIMIGPLAVTVGPGLFLCYLIASVIAVTSSMCYAQVASVFPATAASFQYAKMFYGDFVGFLVGWLRVVNTFFGLALMGKGFAEYVSPYFKTDIRLTAVLVLTIYFIINLLGIKTTQRVQTLLVIIVVGGLAIFCGAGVFKIKIDNLTPVFAAGPGALIKGSMTAFYAYTGLYFIAEIGGEVQEPNKTIPRSICIAGGVIGFLYFITALVFSGGLGWQAIKQYQPNLAEAAGFLFRPSIAAVIQLSALTAVINPINSLYITGSRFLCVLSGDKKIPPVFSRLNRFNVPATALSLVYFISLIIVLIDLPVLYLGAIGSIVNLIAMTLVAGICFRIQNEYPCEFKNAPFKMSDSMLKLLPKFTIICALILILISFTADIFIMFSFMFWIATGSAYYFITRKPPLINRTPF